MPTIKSSEKRLRQNKKRHARNNFRKKELKKVIKEINNAIENGDKQTAQDKLPDLMKLTDKAVSHGPLHKNKASRIKSKFMKRIDDLSQ